MIPFSVLWREARTKSLVKMLNNHVLAHWREEVHGVVLDVACGQSPSYRRALGLNNNPQVQLIGVDIDSRLNPTVVADLNQPWPFKSEAADVAIVSSFLPIGPSPERLFLEAKRILKPKGLLLLTAPLVHAHTPDPTDYWRFTEETLLLLLRQSGFSDVVIQPVGGRWSAAAHLLSPFLIPRWLTPALIYWFCLNLDAWTQARFKRIAVCPIGYVTRARRNS